MGALDEHGAHIGVHEEIDVALPVAQLYVGQTVVLLRQSQHRLGEKSDGVDMDGELAGAGAKDVTRDANVVAEVEQFVELKALLSHGIQTDVNLQPLAALLELSKPGLALGANGHEAPGYCDLGPRGIQYFGRCFFKLLAQLSQGVRSNKLVGIGRLAQGCYLVQLIFAERKEIALEFRLEQWLPLPRIITAGGVGGAGAKEGV